MVILLVYYIHLVLQRECLAQWASNYIAFGLLTASIFDCFPIRFPVTSIAAVNILDAFLARHGMYNLSAESSRDVCVLAGL